MSATNLHRSIQTAAHQPDVRHTDQSQPSCKKLSGKRKATPLIKTAYSQNRSPEQAAKELYNGLKEEGLEYVIFFCSVEYDLPALAEALKAQFGDIHLLGCTTAGEITPMGYKRGTITGFSLPTEFFSVEAVLIDDLYNFSFADAQIRMNEALHALERKAVAPMEENTFALSLLDGLAIREEMVLNALNDSLHKIPLVGGSAGDALDFKDTHVFYNDKFLSDAAIIVMVNTRCPFEVFSSHHMQAGNTKLVVTAADPQARVVQEFNAEPAALEYARAIGVPLEQLSLKTFALHPIGVNIHDHYFIRSIQQVNDDLSLTFFCAIDEGIVFSTCHRGNQVAHLQKLLKSLDEAIGKPQLIIGCDCILRRIEIDQQQRQHQMSRLFIDNNIIGFETYGEQIHAMHVNQTFSGIAIGAPSN